MLAIAARLALNPLLGEGTYPFVTLFIALVFVSRYAGLGPGLLALALGALGSIYFIFPPFGQLDFERGAGIGLLVYLLTGAGCVAVGHQVYRVQRIAQDNARAALASEARARTVIANANAGLVQTDAEGRMILVNERWCEMLGYSEAELLGQSLEAFVEPLPAAAVEARTLQAAGESGIVVEQSYRRKDGSLLVTSNSFSILRSSDGTYQGLTGVVLDITARIQAEAQISRSWQTLFELVERAPFGIYIVDAELRIAHMNSGSQTGAFRNVRPIIGRDLGEVMHILWPEAVARTIVAAFHQTLETGESYRAPGLTEPRHDVEAVESYEWELQRLTLPDGQYGVVCYYFDTTRLRQAEQDALRAKSEQEQARLLVEEADRRKDTFLAILAHELRNPLAPIRTGLELLRLTPGTVERVRPMLERQVNQLVRLVDDLLDVSRITTGRIELQRQRTPVAELVHHAVEANRTAIDEAGVVLSVTLPDRPYQLDVDPTRFVQVLSNLLHNAAKFTDRGGQITIDAAVDDGASGSLLTLRVRDTGIGIPPAVLPHVFDLFVQGQSAERGKTGLGIGLALARQLIEMHGGRIGAHSDGAGHGSVFTLEMPVVATAPSAEAPAADEAMPATVARRVLIVDDNVDAADAMAALIEALGGEAQTANDGPTGLRRAAAFHPDVILLDIGMPGMDGYETCRRLRAEPAGRQAYVVALTGWGQQQDKERALNGGFDAHLTKPADPRVLEALIADAGKH